MEQLKFKIRKVVVENKLYVCISDIVNYVLTGSNSSRFYLSLRYGISDNHKIKHRFNSFNGGKPTVTCIEIDIVIQFLSYYDFIKKDTAELVIGDLKKMRLDFTNGKLSIDEPDKQILYSPPTYKYPYAFWVKLFGEESILDVGELSRRIVEEIGSSISTIPNMLHNGKKRRYLLHKDLCGNRSLYKLANFDGGGTITQEEIDNYKYKSDTGNTEARPMQFWVDLFGDDDSLDVREIHNRLNAMNAGPSTSYNNYISTAKKKGYVSSNSRNNYIINRGYCNFINSNNKAASDTLIKNESFVKTNSVNSNIPFHEAVRLLTEQNTPIRRACWDKGVYMIGEKVSGKYRLVVINKNNAVFNTDWWANDWEIFVRYPELQIDAANTNEDGGLAYHKTLLLIDNNKEAAKVLIKLPDLVAKPFLMRFLPVLFTPENAGNKIEIQADNDTLRKIEKFIENFKQL